jgi:hypothetical protein
MRDRVFSQITLAALLSSANLCFAQDRLQGFRNAEPSVVNGAPQHYLLLDQAWRSLSSSDSTMKLAEMRYLMDVERSNGAGFLKYVFSGQLADQTWQKFLTSLEAARSDEQKGAGQSSGGSTSLVSLPGAPAILSAAVEAGALTQSTSNGPQTTFQGNAVGIGRLLLQQDQFPLCGNTDPKTGKLVDSCEQPLIRALKPLTFSVSVESNGQKMQSVPVSGVATPGTTTGTPSSVSLPSSSSRISAWGVRYTLRNPHALDSQTSRTQYFQSLAKPGQALSAAASKFWSPDTAGYPMFHTHYVAWLNSAAGALAALPANTTQAAFEAEIARNVDALATIMKNDYPNFQSDGLAAWQAYQDFYQARESALNVLPNAAILTIEYTHNDPVAMQSTSDFRFIASYQPTKSLLITANATAEIYNSTPPSANVSQFRDAQISAEADLSLPQWKSGTPVFSAAGYFQYQNAPALINITNANLAPGTNIALPTGSATVLGQRGNIVIGQIKLTIPIKTSGVSFPVGITWSNHTELLKANDIVGHFGIQFDLDSLFTNQGK